MTLASSVTRSGGGKEGTGGKGVGVGGQSSFFSHTLSLTQLLSCRPQTSGLAGFLVLRPPDAPHNIQEGEEEEDGGKKAYSLQTRTLAHPLW